MRVGHHQAVLRDDEPGALCTYTCVRICKHLPPPYTTPHNPHKPHHPPTDCVAYVGVQRPAWKRTFTVMLATAGAAASTASATKYRPKPLPPFPRADPLGVGGTAGAWTCEGRGVSTCVGMRHRQLQNHAPWPPPAPHYPRPPSPRPWPRQPPPAAEATAADPLLLLLLLLLGCPVPAAAAALARRGARPPAAGLAPAVAMTGCC